MKDDWSDYPIAIFRTAVRSNLGGFAALYAGMVLGTLPCTLFDGSYEDLSFSLLLVPLAPLVLSGIQIWGVLYAGWLAVVLYRLIHEDAPRLRAVLLIAPIHHTVHALAYFVGERLHSELSYDWPAWALPYLLYAGLLAPALWWRRRQRLRAERG